MLLAGVMLAPVFAQAADKPAAKAEKPAAEAASGKKAERTLAELVELVLKGGKEKKLDRDSAESLGLLKEEKMIKSMRYTSDISPDKKGHHLAVVIVATEGAKVQATDLVWRVTKVTEKEGAKFIEGWGFRTALDGTLHNAFWSSGEVGVEVSQEVKPIDSVEVRSAFEREKRFFLVEAISLPLTK